MTIHSAPPLDPAAEQAERDRQLEQRERTHLYVEECRLRYQAATVPQPNVPTTVTVQSNELNKGATDE